MPKITHEIPDLVHEGHLRKAVQFLFPDIYTFANSRNQVKNPTTGFFFELDIWLPKLGIGFEFQDIHHYITTWYYHKSISIIQQQDDNKYEELQRLGATLIQVPCWWDSRWESLAVSIKFHRPDLLPDLPLRARIPIPLNPPTLYFQKRSITGLGELMHASFPIATTADTMFSPGHFWWLGEKYDGVRCLWNYERRTLYSRSGVEADLPSKMTRFFPPLHFESEAWFGRGMYNEAQQIAGLETDSLNYSNLRLIAFDTPALVRLPFEKRYRRLFRLFRRGNPFISVAMRVSCFDKFQLAWMLQQVIDDEGEGVVLQKPRSLYEPGRSHSLLKFKSTRADKEALVLDTEGAEILLKLPNGVKFNAPRDSFDFAPKNGDIWTFSYEHFTKKEIPLNPTFYRVRTDVSWDNVVQDYFASASQKQALNEISREVLSDAQKPSRYYSDRANMKLHFENFAREKNLDPLNPESWYSLNRTEMLTEHKGIATISKMFKGGVVAVLLNLFPDIGLDESKFEILRSNYWLDVNNRKEFFKSFAAEEGFDPLIADNWHTLPKDNLRLQKAMTSLMNVYKGSLAKGLIHVFPDIGLDPTKFFPNSYWPDTVERRDFFLQYATSKSFDPFIAENWYSVSLGDVLAHKGAYPVLHYYRHNLPRALTLLFPDIGLEISKFEKKNYWSQISNRRIFFENFAKWRGFEVFDLTQWYSVIVEDLFAFSQEAHDVMSIYSGKIDSALLKVFPELNFHSSRFVCNKFWGVVKNQVEFFHELAAKHKLNPLNPSDWYSLDVETILESKGAHTILSFYNGSHAKAIMRAFPHIGLELLKFAPRLRSYWTVPENQKQFFCDIAKDKGFDPLIAKNWYPLTATKILEYKGGGSVLSYHGGSLPNSLLKVFPDIGLDRAMFSLWLNAKHRKPSISHPVALRSARAPI